MLMINKMATREPIMANVFNHQNPADFVVGSINNPIPNIKKKRNLPGTPDPEAEVIALSPKTLMATNRFLCEICGKGFQRDQNLQLHRRGHNLPWKLRQRSSKEPRKRVYVCPEKGCVHNHPSRALGDLTGIKKHFCRKHGEKKWKCDKCSKRYAVQSDQKAHAKTCGTREYKCDCGTLFSRRDSFLTHRAFCDALAEETARVTAASNINHPLGNYHQCVGSSLGPNMVQHFSSIFKPLPTNDEELSIKHDTPGLSLWMGQGSSQVNPLGNTTTTTTTIQELHQMGSSNLETLYSDPFSHQQSDYQLDWVLGRKLSSTSSGELLTSIKEDGSPPQLLSAPSLYSTQHQQQQPFMANMSATALLQKAAQIGATTATSPSLLMSFGVKQSSDDHNQDVMSKFNGFCFGSNLCTSTNLAETSLVDLSPTINQFQMYPPAPKRRKLEDTEGGQTRDFLGVGVKTTTTAAIFPSSINGGELMNHI
ncbi:hypothetical protein MKW94_004171 [Papaver nudicaule]|uniref:C2H2-type domain-containing protein n=1 Tax=Papaver nudicaule TaxID=74823 RepID=A0AA41S803_PAPNU|nr:hypothetical protein [Papaver nudicaule]